MKIFVSILFLVSAVCVGCELRPTSSQTPQSASPPPSPTPTPATPAVQDMAPCSLVMDQAPVINGLRLGMTPEEVLALFPGSKDDAEVRASLSRPPSKFGESEFLIRPDKYGTKEKFAGITQITFNLLDGRVSSFYVGYNGPAWAHVDEFVTRFIKETNLPPADSWEAYVGMDNQIKTLRCKDFETRVFAGGEGGNLNSVLMTDLAAAKKLEERRDKDKADAKATP